MDDAAVVRMRDTMARRGPDGSGLWRHENVVLAHRRLAVIAPGPQGHQPLVTPSGAAIVYNGELYNDADVRAELRREGVIVNGPSDTATVAAALERWGHGAISLLRGMYALGFVDARRERLLLARDPLGIKPLFWMQVDGDLVFASDVRALLSHPRAHTNPDLATASAYLTTLRLTLGSRTLFAGVRTLLPGEWLEFDLTGSQPAPKVFDWWDRKPAVPAPQSDTAASVRIAVEDSVRRHLRSDVPLCCLLSGGLDSTIIATAAKKETGGDDFWTYCAGAVEAPGLLNDFHYAKQVSALLGSHHVEAPVSGDMFRDRWAWMVAESGMPLSTPNEVAINEVARRLRADGKIVALSGEGADELFGGYEAVMEDAFRRFAGLAGCDPGPWRERGGEIMLAASAWVPAGQKHGVLEPHAIAASENDGHLVAFVRDEFARLSQDCPDPMQVALRYQRRINLEGLLRRLDSATMLEGVEGRTPFADQDVALLAESLALSAKYSADVPEPRGKLVLRSAFERDVPLTVRARPKASFPLPFQEWGQAASDVLSSSFFAKETLTEAARAVLVHTSWTQHGLWRIGWPTVNLALWGQRWWG